MQGRGKTVTEAIIIGMGHMVYDYARRNNA